ncbi:MAG: glycyl-radical enzyme activating protein [Eubacteriales bacterium]|nr:glycyl-radical enzyme activating protein [Eubacteriales bacterium]
MTGTVFNIQRFCVNDGPGIRTTVFLKGCPLSCAWCHNPESKSPRPELFYDADKCVSCGRCVSLCPQKAHLMENGRHQLRRESCVRCMACAETHCPALAAAGETRRAEDIMAEVLRDRPFYQASGGGMTLSGGEPFFQEAFALDLLRLAREAQVHTCVETCGFAPLSLLEQAARWVDLFLYDIKLTDPALHRQWTGVSNDRILENLRALDKMGAKTVLRCPVIPGVNDTLAHFQGVAKIANSLTHLQEIHLEPYHPLGVSKARRLGRESLLEGISFPSEAAVQDWIRQIQPLVRVNVRKS